MTKDESSQMISGLALAALLMVFVCGASSIAVHAQSAAQSRSSKSIPAAKDFSRLVMKVLKSYPTDRTHLYHWPKKGSWKGCTQDLKYAGQVFAKGDPQGRAYCCGLTFEVFFKAWERWCKEQKQPFTIAGMSLQQVKTLQSQWFGSASDHSCIYTAITKNKIGRRITNWEKAKPGDFVQLWRNSGSGHSVIFMEWKRDSKRRIKGLTYWSTQKPKGIGKRTEYFGNDRKHMKRDKFWICRVGK